jgi:hypothetical protein
MRQIITERTYETSLISDDILTSHRRPDTLIVASPESVTYRPDLDTARRLVMGRRLYYQDSYGRVQRDRQSEKRAVGRSGLPARPFITALMVLAILMVLASMIH